MLSSEYVEASCVQCHKSSMELIAKEAPHVSEGYRLFEHRDRLTGRLFDELKKNRDWLLKTLKYPL